MFKIKKVWGARIRLLKTNKLVIDLLFLKKNTFCSTHYHNDKINTFIKLWGKILIESFLTNVKLISSKCYCSEKLKGYNPIIINPPEIHRFKVLKPSIIIEVIHSKKEVKEGDIIRLKQGGRMIHNREYTEKYLKNHLSIKYMVYLNKGINND